MQPSEDYRVNTDMIYLTFADQPSGVFSSQVIDVCKYIDQSFPVKIRLVAFISIRGFKENKKKIRKEHPDAMVLPMLPRLSNWRMNKVTLYVACLFLRPASIIARGVLAANLALSIRDSGLVRKVCYDGRGAIAAEWNEYTVTPDENLKAVIPDLEKRAVMQCDFRIGVSSRLVDYWRERYNYNSSAHVVIPCTLGNGFSGTLPPPDQLVSTRRSMGFEPDDLIMVYSGSTAGWQSFSILETFLTPILKADKKNKVLFLSRPDESISRLKDSFPDQVSDKWISHNEVQQVLSACDYGILIREESVTNKVASPTKFAEYLSAGLAVLISEHIGDYSDFVVSNGCGYLIRSNSIQQLSHLNQQEKEKMASLVQSNFTKESQNKNYKKLIDSISYHLN